MAKQNDAPKAKRGTLERFADLLLSKEATEPKSKITNCDVVDGSFSRYEIRSVAFKASGGTLFVAPRAPRTDAITLAGRALAGRALGQINRQAGQIKRLEAKLAASEKLAETRLHGRGVV